MKPDTNTYEKVLDALRCIKRHQHECAELRGIQSSVNEAIKSIEGKLPQIYLNNIIADFKAKTDNQLNILPVLGDRKLLRASYVSVNDTTKVRATFDIVFSADVWTVERDIFENVVKTIYKGDCYETAVLELYEYAKKVEIVEKEIQSESTQKEILVEEKTEQTNTQEDVDVHSHAQTEVLQDREDDVSEVHDVYQDIVNNMSVKEKERYDKFKKELLELSASLEPAFEYAYKDFDKLVSYENGSRTDYIDYLVSAIKSSPELLKQYAGDSNTDNLTATDEELRTIVDLAGSIVENNKMVQGLPKPTYNKSSEYTGEFKERHLIDLMIYLILKKDVIVNRVLNTVYKQHNLDKEFFINLTYHFVAYDNFKSVISPQRTNSQLVLAVEAVNSIFTAHNFNLTFYENTQLVEKPNLNPDNWTNQVEVIGKLAEAFSDKGNVTKISANVVHDVIKHIDKLKTQSLTDNDLFTINPLMTDIVNYLHDTNFFYKHEDCIVLRGDETKPMITILPNIVVVSFIKHGKHSAANVYNSDKLFDVIRWLCYSFGG